MFYFSGTGNSKYIAELFCEKTDARCYSIEESFDFEEIINAEETLAFCYPVYMSRVPRIMREFAASHMESLKNKKIIIFCTQMLLSGDGARAFAALFPRGHVNVIYAEHFFMPNNVSNSFIVPMASERLVKKYIRKSQRRMKNACENIKTGKIKKRGFNVFSQMLGFFQAPFLPWLERKANRYVKITDDCTKCGICVSCCPTKNLVCESDALTHKNNCTMCCRCLNKCPKKAISPVFYGKVKKQYIFKV
jgi:ferredoxin